MARRYRYAIIKKKEAKKGKLSVGLAIASLLLFGAAVGTAYVLEGSYGFIVGGSDDNVAMENGLKFHVDWLKGQKTGFFVDQRENRSLLEKFAQGRKVLNMFCYTGGFSFYAMRGGAEWVHSVDSSAKAIELTTRNVEMNFPGDKRHEAYCEDGRPLRPYHSRSSCICQAPRCLAQCTEGLHPTESKGF